MNNKLIYIFLIIVLCFSCSKKEPIVEELATEEKSFAIYKEALDSMEAGDLFYASKKFEEAEAVLPKIEYSAKALLMSSFCLYTINFYDESLSALEKYIAKYPADKNIPYAHYLIAMCYYEQILDEKKEDIKNSKGLKSKGTLLIDNHIMIVNEFEFKNDLVVGPGTLIRPGTKVGRHVYMGAGTIIDINCTIFFFVVCNVSFLPNVIIFSACGFKNLAFGKVVLICSYLIKEFNIFFNNAFLCSEVLFNFLFAIPCLI